MHWFLGPRPEPVEMLWANGTVTVEYGIDVEWWNERLGRNLKLYWGVGAEQEHFRAKYPEATG